MMSNSRLAVFTALAMAAAPAALVAQNPTKWTAKTDSLPIDQGDTAHVTLQLKVETGWHVYSITQGAGGPTPTKITVPKDQPFSIGGPIESTAPMVKFDKNFSMQVESHEDVATFVVP